jgi:hypothetical protein
MKDMASPYIGVSGILYLCSLTISELAFIIDNRFCLSFIEKRGLSREFSPQHLPPSLQVDTAEQE